MPVFAVVVRRPRTDGGSDDNRIDLGGHRMLHVSRDEQEGANERSYRSAENASIRIAAANFLRGARLHLRRQNRRPDSNASLKRLSRDAPERLEVKSMRRSGSNHQFRVSERWYVTPDPLLAKQVESKLTHCFGCAYKFPIRLGCSKCSKPEQLSRSCNRPPNPIADSAV